MTTPPSRAEQAVVDAEAAVWGERCTTQEAFEAAIAGLIRAVRHHCAETVRADTGHIRYGSAMDYANRHAALLDLGAPVEHADVPAEACPVHDFRGRRYEQCDPCGHHRLADCHPKES